jgi:LysM repeat protein
MKDDPELELNDTWSDESTHSLKRRRVEPGKRKSIPILLGIVLVLVLAGGIVYFFSKQSAGDGASPLESKVTALGEKVAGLEKQVADLERRIAASVPAPALAQKAETPEKQKQSTAEPKAKPSAPSKPAVSPEKQYHTVQKGESLSRISKKYGMSVDELRKLNNLSADKPIRVGQKLLVSRGR